MRPAATVRESRRSHRHSRIERAALELFRERGFDRVTVEDVCAQAGVGPATFYRHFGTKEEVVFAYEEQFTAALQQAVAASAAIADRRDRLGCILSAFAGYLESQQEVLAVRDEIVLGHPALLRRTLAVQRALENELALGLARLRGLDEPDDAAALDAMVGLGVLRVATRWWRAGHRNSLPAATEQALALLDGLAGPAR